MAQRAIISLAAVWALVTVLCACGAAAQSSDGCTSALVSLSPCLNYINGNETTPSSSCCTQLASVVKSEPQCLCAVLSGGGSSFGITINQTQALALPTACKVQTPPASRCNSSGAPTGSPSTPTPSTPATPAGGGSKTLPSSDNSGGSYAVAAPASVIISILLAVASFTF